MVVLALAATAAGTSPAAAAADGPAIWIGSPVGGSAGVKTPGDSPISTWSDLQYCPGGPDYRPQTLDFCGLPNYHHITYPDSTGADDWAMDLQTVAGYPVYLYAAPKDTALNNRITAKVEQVGAACSNTKPPAGQAVRIGLYLDNTARVGSVVYAHIKTGLKPGQLINRWAGYVGTVGGPNDGFVTSDCWGGPHLHVEMVSQKNFACYGPQWRPSQPIYLSQYIGYMGGRLASAQRAACPVGA